MFQRNIAVFHLQVKRFCPFMQNEPARFPENPHSAPRGETSLLRASFPLHLNGLIPIFLMEIIFERMFFFHGVETEHRLPAAV